MRETWKRIKESCGVGMGAAKFIQVMKTELKFEPYLPGSLGKKEMR